MSSADSYRAVCSARGCNTWIAGSNFARRMLKIPFIVFASRTRKSSDEPMSCPKILCLKWFNASEINYENLIRDGLRKKR